MSGRAERVGAEIQRAIQEVIAKGLSDPRIKGVVTVTRVEVSPDLAQAKVGVSVLPEDAQELTMHGIRSAAKHIRHHVGELTALRRTPRLTFELDETLKRQAKLLSALRDAGAGQESEASTNNEAPEEPTA